MSEKNNQNFLFKSKDWRENEWDGMPEYIQNKLIPFRVIKMHFKNQEDVDAFEKLIGQKIHAGYNTYWYPKLNIKTSSNKRYVDKK